MPGRIFNRSVKLELDTESDVYFLPPRQRTDPESGDTRETDDNAPSGSRTLLTGTATLTLTNSKHIDAVQVDLVRFYISGGLSAHELKDNHSAPGRAPYGHDRWHSASLRHLSRQLLCRDRRGSPARQAQLPICGCSTLERSAFRAVVFVSLKTCIEAAPSLMSVQRTHILSSAGHHRQAQRKLKQTRLSVLSHNTR